MYPNHFADVITIRKEHALSGSSTKAVNDISGSLVKNEVVSFQGNKMELNISTLPVGRYFFKVTNEDIVLQSSFTKN